MVGIYCHGNLIKLISQFYVYSKAICRFPKFLMRNLLKTLFLGIAKVVTLLYLCIIFVSFK